MTPEQMKALTDRMKRKSEQLDPRLHKLKLAIFEYHLEMRADGLEKEAVANELDVVAACLVSNLVEDSEEQQKAQLHLAIMHLFEVGSAMLSDPSLKEVLAMLKRNK